MPVRVGGVGARAEEAVEGVGGRGGDEEAELLFCCFCVVGWFCVVGE